MVRAEDLAELGALLEKLTEVSFRVGDEGLTRAVGQLIEQQQRLKYLPQHSQGTVWKRSPVKRAESYPLGGPGSASAPEAPVAAQEDAPAPYREPLPPARPYNPNDTIIAHELKQSEIERLHRGDVVGSFVVDDAEDSLQRAVGLIGDKDPSLIANYAGVTLAEAQRFLARRRR